MSSDTALAATPAPDDDLNSLLLGVAGGVLVASRSRLPRVTRDVATLGGLALMGWAAYGPLSRLVRQAGSRRRAADIRMSFVIDRPVERVFAFCRDFENYPRFVGALRSVRDYGDGRSRWCATTATGELIEWSAITTKYVPNRVVGWQTVAGSPVNASGLLRFSPEEGGTRVDVRLSYELAAPANLREAITALVLPPRARQIESDIERLAHYLDTAPDAELLAYGV